MQYLFKTLACSVVMLTNAFAGHIEVLVENKDFDQQCLTSYTKSFEKKPLEERLSLAVFEDNKPALEKNPDSEDRKFDGHNGHTVLGIRTNSRAVTPISIPPVGQTSKPGMDTSDFTSADWITEDNGGTLYKWNRLVFPSLDKSTDFNKLSGFKIVIEKAEGKDGCYPVGRLYYLDQNKNYVEIK
jgi:hypothetical protein